MLVTGSDDEPRRVGANVLVLLDRQLDRLRAIHVSTLAHPFRIALVQPSLVRLEPLVEVSKNDLVPGSANSALVALRVPSHVSSAYPLVAESNEVWDGGRRGS